MIENHRSGLLWDPFTSGEEFVGPSTEGAGGESERLAVLNLTETLIYLGAISLEINFLTSS